MQLQAVMLANYAEGRDGLLTVVGGGWEYATVLSMPGALRMYVTGILAREHDEMGASITLTVRLDDPSGTTITEVPLTFDTLHIGTAEGVPVRSPFFAAFDFPVNETGIYRVAIQDPEGKELAELPFEVQHANE